MYMTGHYDRFGKRCTEVHEANRTFFVDKSPMEILDDSIKSIGFDYRGALAASKCHLGDIEMPPVMVNPILRIAVFPTRSANHEDTIWFNPCHIKRTLSTNRKTKILFSNGAYLILPTRLSSFNTKIQNAEQLRGMTKGTFPDRFAFILDPEKRPDKKKR